MPSSRSGAGGKIVTNRRKHRVAATPYDRPRPPPRPPQKSPNWFTGMIVPSARAIVSGAGRIFSSIFSESESSSSEDEDSVSEDGVDNDNRYGNLYERDSNLNKETMSSSKMMHYGEEPQTTMWHAETKKLIEQLIMQETFSREECDKLIQVLNSRVIDCSTEEREKHSLADPNSHEGTDIFNEAVKEAKKWFKEKKVGSSSVTEFTHETSKVDSGGGPPVDVARTYMKDRPPWASPTRNFELKTPLTSNLFNEGALYSAGPESLSSSKKRNSLASGSWNIQEELRRVRSKATDDMLRTPSSKLDPLLFAVPKREESVGVSKAVFALGEQMTERESLRKAITINELVDAGVCYDPALTALGSRQDGKASEALSARPATSLHGNNEDPQAVWVDGECVASRSPHLSSPKHTEERLSDAYSNKSNGPPTAEVTESTVNGFSLLQASVPAGAATSGPHTDEDNELHIVENNDADTLDESKSVNANQVESNCELLTESYTEVPIITETNSITSGSQNSIDIIQHDDVPPDPPQPSPKEKVKYVPVKQQGTKLVKYNQRKLRKR